MRFSALCVAIISTASAQTWPGTSTSWGSGSAQSGGQATDNSQSSGADQLGQTIGNIIDDPSATNIIAAIPENDITTPFTDNMLQISEGIQEAKAGIQKVEEGYNNLNDWFNSNFGRASLNLQQTQDVCRRVPPNIAFEWDDHDVWGWWYDVQAEYAASDADFYALWNRWQDDKHAVVEKYLYIWEDLVLREREIDISAMQDVCRYVSMNVYVNGIRLGYVIPELHVYMAENYDPYASNIISMFALDELPMLQGTLPEVPMNFDLTIHPEEIQEIMQIRLDQYAETTAMLEAYKQEFIVSVTEAWERYVEATAETVQMEAQLHREVVEDTINYLWDGSAYPGANLDDVYPRPQVMFAAKNQRLARTPTMFSTRNAAVTAVAILGFAALFCAFKRQENAKKALMLDEPVELDSRKEGKSKRMNIFKRKKTEKEQAKEEERQKINEPLL